MVIQVGETWFLDTNILLSATNESRPSHRAVLGLSREVDERGGHLAISDQIAREYLVVATRPPEENGLGLEVGDAVANVEEFRRMTVFLDEGASVHGSLVNLLEEYPVRVKRIHDANVVATVQTHGVSVLVTENAEDFSRFEQIEIQSLK